MGLRRVWGDLALPVKIKIHRHHSFQMELRGWSPLHWAVLVSHTAPSASPVSYSCQPGADDENEEGELGNKARALQHFRSRWIWTWFRVRPCACGWVCALATCYWEDKKEVPFGRLPEPRTEKPDKLGESGSIQMKPPCACRIDDQEGLWDVECWEEAEEAVEENRRWVGSCCGTKRGKLISSEGRRGVKRSGKGKENEKQVYVFKK